LWGATPVVMASLFLFLLPVIKKYPEAGPPPLKLLPLGTPNGERVNFGAKRLSDAFFQLLKDCLGVADAVAGRPLPVKLSVAGDLFFDFFARHQDRRVVLIA